MAYDSNDRWTGAVWRKSSHSANGGNCVETARLGALVAVRDSVFADGPRLVFSVVEWKGLLAALRTDDLMPREAMS